jgi:uncharacterized membrane protein
LIAAGAGLKPALARAMVGIYLLYPLLFNVNLFDFHPETIALPLFLAAVLAVQRQRLGWFCLCLVLISGCKAVLSLTIVGLGAWLLVEKRYRYGWIALGFGLVWLWMTSQVIIPHFSGAEAAAVRRYAYLGSSVIEIAQNLLLKPWLLLGRVFSFETLGYLLLLLAPVVWCLSPRRLTPLIAAVPALVLNILADGSPQRDLVHQYALPIFPFLLLAVVDSLASGKTILQRPHWILLWSAIGFIALAKYGYFGSLYLNSLDTWRETRSAIALVKTADPVLTTHSIATHLAHRQVIKFTQTDQPPDLSRFGYVLLNLKHPGWRSTPEFAAQLQQQLTQDPNFVQVYQQQQVYLFARKQSAALD